MEEIVVTARYTANVPAGGQPIRTPSLGGQSHAPVSGINVEIVNLVQVEGEALTYRIGEKKILDNVNVTLDPGEMVALLGPSGAGFPGISQSVSLTLL